MLLNFKPTQILNAKFLALAFLCNLFLYSFICKSEQVNAHALPALTVTLSKVQRTEFTNLVSANGNIAAWQEAIIGTELNGLRLGNVLVNVGDTVKKGQLLASFSDETIQAELAQAKGSLIEAEALAREAENNAARSRTLLDTGALSNQQLDQFTALAETSHAKVEINKAIVNAHQIRLGHTKIYAPDNGVISSRSATIGSIVNAGSELFKLIRQSRLEWRAELISTDLPKIKPNMKVKITAEDGSNFFGTVRKISPTVDIQTRNTLVYVDIPKNSSVKAGMFAKGDFLLGKSVTLSLPQQALVMHDGFTYVFVVNKNRAKKIRIQTGQRSGNSVQILSGIEPNQMVVAKGASFLADNDLVKVVSTPDSAPVTNVTRKIATPKRDQSYHSIQLR